MIKINKDWTKDQNFWEINPQLTLHKPFSELYNNDKSKNKEDSSLDAWMIFFLTDPDPTKNTFYRIPYQQRLATLQETYHEHFNPSEPIVKTCLEQYPQLILTAVERSLKEEIDSMVQRAELLRNTPYTLDKTTVENNKAITIKGTATQLDSMRAKTPKLYENYEKLQQKFIKQQEDTRIRGGRKETASEKGLLVLLPLLLFLI